MTLRPAFNLFLISAVRGLAHSLAESARLPFTKTSRPSSAVATRSAFEGCASSVKVLRKYRASEVSVLRNQIHSGVWASTGLPGPLIAPMLISAERFYGMPLSRGNSADLVKRLNPRPLLLLHNEDDPIIPASEARALHAAYPRSRLVVFPALPASDARAAAFGRWGSHSKEFVLHREAWLSAVQALLTEVLGSAASSSGAP